MNNIPHLFYRYFQCMKRPAVPTRSPRKKDGQILVLMALLSTTLVILFGMVVGIGHLIQAKMNLQNSVDLAAMSGASWQARMMNHIALINYRLRQNYKFQLYDFYVTASRFNVGLRKQLTNPNPGIFERLPKSQTSFGICQQSFGFNGNFSDEYFTSHGGPVSIDQDLCKNIDGINGHGKAIPPIIPSPIVNLNPILIAANAMVISLAAELKKLCKSARDDNKTYFNIAVHSLQKRQEFQVKQILAMVKEFSDAFPPQSDDVGNDGIGNQTIMRTLRENLISANKDPSLKVSWITPQESRAFRMDSSTEAGIFAPASLPSPFGDYLLRQRVSFSFPYADFGSNCSPEIKVAQQNTIVPPIPPTIIGFGRTRNLNNDEVKIPIFTGIQATVTPKLLFWPQSLTPTLVAVGVAKPFGSRIGPPNELTNLEVDGIPGKKTEAFLVSSQANMSFYPGDVDEGLGSFGGNWSGIGHKVVLNHLFASLGPNGPGAGQNHRRPSISNPQTSGSCSNPLNLPFLCLASAPTLYEGLFFNAFQFPPAQNPYVQAAFPWEFNNLIQLADQTKYLLPDRQIGISFSPTQLAQWHYTTPIGSTPEFRSNGKAALFADPSSAQSSWSPDYKLDDVVPSSGPGAADKTDPRGRQGYAIKLVSVNQICDEIKKGGASLTPTPTYTKYCTSQSKLYH